MPRIARRIAGIGASDLPDAAAFDAYIGPAREITVDQQRGIIALHDGITAGGHQFRKGGGGDAAIDPISKSFAGKAGANQTYDLDVVPSTASNVFVWVGNSRQRPDVDYTIDGLTLTILDNPEGLEVDTIIMSGPFALSTLQGKVASDFALAKTSSYQFDTEEDFVAGVIPAPVLVIGTGGYHSVGDGGGHTKIRIDAPTGPLPHQKQCADGSWWEIVGDIDPRFLGARGQGKTVSDDTSALQGALDTGRNICVSPGTYYYTSITGGVRGQRIYSRYPLPVGAERQTIEPTLKLMPVLQTDRNDGLFGINITAHQVHFDGIAFDGEDRLILNQNCIRFAKSSNTDDTDGYVTNCIFMNYRYAVEHVGRALTAQNNIFVSTNYPIRLKWPSSGTDYTAAPQAPPLGHRSCRIIGNRFHSCQQGIVSEDETLRGAIIALNIGDIGDRLFEGSGGVNKCLFYGNIFDQCNKSPVYITGPVIETEFSANHFGGIEGNMDESPFAGIHIENAGTVRGLLINGNMFTDIDGHAITIQGTVATVINNVSIIGNMFRNIGADGNVTRAILSLLFNIDGLIFMGNNCKSAAPPHVIRFNSGTLTMKNSVVTGNVWDTSKAFFNTYVDDGTNTIMIGIGGLYQNSDGKLGIGTNAPTHRVHIADTISNVLKLVRSGSTAGVGIVFENTVGSFSLFGAPTGAGIGNLTPSSDNGVALGSGGMRWSQLFAGTGTINTSDERLKADISAIEEIVLDAWEEVEWVQFRFTEGKRIHIGLIAQRVKAVFEKHGLDPFALGILCHDKWDADDETGITAGDRYGIRYEEALALEAAWNRRELQKIKSAINS